MTDIEIILKGLNMLVPEVRIETLENLVRHQDIRLREITKLLDSCDENERYCLQGGIFNWPLLVQDLLTLSTKR